MPPPVTPSPYRFIATPEQNKASHRPKSRQSAAQVPLLPQSHLEASTPVRQDAATPSQQFKPTPRFSIPRQRPNFASQLSSSSTPAHAEAPQSINSPNDTGSVHPLRGLRPKLNKVESIHDASQEGDEHANSQENSDSGDEVMLFDLATAQDTVLVELQGDTLEGGTVDRSPPEILGDSSISMDEQPAKRRRLAPNPELPPRADSVANQMDPEKADHDRLAFDTPPQSSIVPRFRARGHSPAPISTSAAEQSSTQSAVARPRNPFLLRPLHTGAAGSIAEDITPLPEYFSPHRRSQKFVPGGMADIVRGWLLSVGHGGLQAEALNNQPTRRPEQILRANQPSKIRVTECQEGRPADRMRLISGRSTDHPRRSIIQSVEDGFEARAVLVGPAKGNSRNLKFGDNVAIAPPSWEVEVGQPEERWTVAVDWNVTI